MNSESVLQIYINKIKADKVEPNKVGSSKACYLGKFAVLKSLKPVTSGNMGFFDKRYRNFETVKAFNNYLINLGVPTSKIYTCKYFENDYYELQERVIGRPLFKYNIDQVCKDALKQDCLAEELSKEQIQVVSNYIFKYNMHTIKLLKEAPQQHFDAFLKGLKALTSLGVREFDDNGENILYNPKTGFMLVDLDIEDFLKNYVANKKHPISEFDAMQASQDIFLEVFDNYSYFGDFDLKLLNSEQLKVMRNENVEVAKKIVTAIKNNNQSLVSDSFSDFLLQKLVGEQNYKVNFSSLTKPQAKGKK